MRARPAEPRSFGDIARELVRAEGGGRFRWRGLVLSTLFQPLHSIEKGAAVGDEALVRATGPDGEPLRARALFESMEPAERIRLDWFCRALHLRNYAVVDRGERKLFLNVHPAALLEDPDGGRSFAQLARFYGVAPGRVFIEVLDSGCGDERRLADSVAGYRDRGFGIAMDQFGEGRSNFDRIARLRPRIVKIDRSVLRGALGETQERRLLPALIGMLGDAGAKVAVKGVENAREALAAIEAGATYLQGFHLGAPSALPREEKLTRELILSARRLAAA